jgi:hypothetical protein
VSSPEKHEAEAAAGAVAGAAAGVDASHAVLPLLQQLGRKEYVITEAIVEPVEVPSAVCAHVSAVQVPELSGNVALVLASN